MSGLSNYAENRLLDHIFDKAEYGPPDVYVGLSAAEPDDDGLGLAEPEGDNYSRVRTYSADWDTASGGSLANKCDIVFPEAAGSWGTLAYFALFDAASGGNMLGSGALRQDRIVGTADTVKFAAGDLIVSLDSCYVA